MVKDPVPAVATAIYEKLAPLSPELRKRVLQGVSGLLGDTEFGGDQSKDKDSSSKDRLTESKTPKGLNLSKEEIGEVFHMEDGITTIVATEIPGKTKKEKTVNVFALIGLGNLLATGKATVELKSAKGECERFKCWDENNSTLNRRAAERLLVGDSQKGYVLSQPGLKHAAGVVKQLLKTPVE